jgi:XapX domain-containing protein
MKPLPRERQAASLSCREPPNACLTLSHQEAVGVIVGVIYGLLRVRSPAPPTVALVGLFGMLAGEQVVTLIRNMLR